MGPHLVEQHHTQQPDQRHERDRSGFSKFGHTKLRDQERQHRPARRHGLRCGRNDASLENTFVRNMNGNALLLRRAVIDAYNCAFANCGLQVANMLYGGTYRWYHCTFANFWSEESSAGTRRADEQLFRHQRATHRREFFTTASYNGNNDRELGMTHVPNAAPACSTISSTTRC